MSRMAGKVALITGAGNGMGRSHAVRLAEEGADIIALDLPGAAADLAETARLVGEAGRRAAVGAADVRDLAAVQAGVDAGVAELGRLDVVVANAGVCDNPGPAWTIDAPVWQRSLDINLTGVWHTVKAAAPSIGAGGGSVVIVSSTAGMKAVAGAAHYSASKHAVIGLMRTLANELGPRSIRVNALLPGAVGTAMTLNPATFARLRPDLADPTAEDVMEVLARNHLLPVPWVESADVSNALLFLVSDEARYITGTELVVDAGLTQKV
ncbi:SDR family mycofactocin-dependent oxidoreductase [Rhodococcus sp. PvR044]|uniref:mycofactocin-coupled SDR family oxidoreductase n=1 Tax=Rhodococcus TaxID=1827 RepID=UPI000BD986A4|nr:MULTISPECIES: mycofactocin-coupled SDR family oxidoreductase [Rhodococcus]MBP1162209.1 SDR family mycofactocin-dependent oxidoreductase [Rhodococcus sp. PvR099]MCZ4554895.1 mycofactocin-coupled SDR family oxidoreductase [Rhodococcus maanshanensis]PTR44904.1 SDR family mycofactocin-dependent oxidoreductase [Rhodococcus sp. OK611]SNX89239.1 SDR family mycofactocin-dependent oxidoreductase [Rhodococcus sp. OK270]